MYQRFFTVVATKNLPSKGASLVFWKALSNPDSAVLQYVAKVKGPGPWAKGRNTQGTVRRNCHHRVQF